MRLQKVIEQFGYKPNEVRVYLTALRLGACTCSDIALQAQLPRTSVQLILEGLHKDGMMNFYIKRRYKYWIAENPERLIDGLHVREAALRAVMPELSAIRDGESVKPTVHLFIGKEEIKLMCEDILTTQHNVMAFVPWDEWVSLLGAEYIADFAERRAQLHLKAQLLVPKTATSIRLKERDATELRQTHFLPEGFVITNAIFVYANKVATVCLNKIQPTAVIVDDSSTGTTMTSFFTHFWNLDKG